VVVHHLTEYQHGGLTNTDQMCLLCPFDHTLITEHGYTVRMGTAGRVEWIAPNTSTPDRHPASTPCTTHRTSPTQTGPERHAAPASPIRELTWWSWIPHRNGGTQ